MSVQSSTGEIAAAGPAPRLGRVPGRRRIGPAAAYAAPFVAFFLLCLFLARTVVVTSDASNNALQGWDLLHGHLLLHDWVIGDATYYGFELPLFAVTTGIFGLGILAAHVEAAAAFTIIAILAAAIAKNRRTGFEGAARVGVVLAVLAASMTTGVDTSAGTLRGFYGPVLLLGEPNHTSTCAFLLASILLLQRKPDWRGTPWVLFAILVVGQVGDVTVRYMFAGAVVLVCGWRTVQFREWRGRDAMFALAAVLSVPASLALRKVMLAMGSYTMVTPPTQIASPKQWLSHFNIALQQIPQLFGVVNVHNVNDSHRLKLVQTACIPLGLIAMALVAFGLVQVLRTWLKADRTDQLLIMGIATFVGGYTVSNVVGWDKLHEFSGVMPVMAVLAARLLPTKLAAAKAAVPVAVVAALVPMVAGVAYRPVPSNPAGALASWLEAHNLHYGIAGYWEASSVTLASHNAVQVRAVANVGYLKAYNWEVQTSWFDPTQHDATFVISNYQDPGNWFGMDPIDVEAILGMPESIVPVDSYDIMIYPGNLLNHVKPAHPVPHGD